MVEGDVAPDASTVAVQAPAARASAKPSRRSILMRIGLLVAIMLVVFVVILPRVVDYDAAIAALSRLSWTELAALAAATAVAYVANAAPSRILIPGLSWPHAIGADLAGRAVVSTIPGPTDIATRFVLYRQWAIPADLATAGIVFNAFFETLSDLVLPLLATIGVFITGGAVRPAVFWLSIAAAAVLAVVMVILAAIVRSESLARRVGRALDAIAGKLWRLVRREPPTGIVDGVLSIRERSHET